MQASPPNDQALSDIATTGHRPAQQRSPIRRAEGVTPSERHLAKLAEASFLNLWSYPAPYRDQKQNRTGDGKELCDLLVVCSPYLIIFSEKTVGWPTGSLGLAWSRWARRAVRDAVEQARGAERWIIQHSDRIFLDRACTQPFPISFPARHIRRMHCVVVANGASEACAQYTDSKTGSLIVCPSVKGADHWSPNPGGIQPFRIGDVDPSGTFVHVFNDTALDTIMTELDTVRDFSDYLQKRSEFVRSGRLLQADGEENLLAYYATRLNLGGEHDFVADESELRSHRTRIRIPSTEYGRFIQDPRYLSKKALDERSRLWDRLTEAFTTNMLQGTSSAPRGQSFNLEKIEMGVRQMALPGRLQRRSLANGVRRALDVGRTGDIYFHMLMSSADAAESTTAFFVLTVKYPVPNVPRATYEEYRQFRVNAAEIYALGVLERNRSLDRVVGIAMEPLTQEDERSEDIVYAEQTDWTDEERRRIQQDCQRFGFLRGDLHSWRQTDHEFPETVASPSSRPQERLSEAPLNRRQRRALRAKQRRSQGRDTR